MKKYFIDYLREQHGLDKDNPPFNEWIAGFDTDDWCDFADLYANTK